MKIQLKVKVQQMKYILSILTYYSVNPHHYLARTVVPQCNHDSYRSNGWYRNLMLWDVNFIVTYHYDT